MKNKDESKSNDLLHQDVQDIKMKNDKEESFRQNASFDEKILPVESIFSTYCDDYDIKKITKEKLENMLQAVNEHQSSLPTELHLGRQAINNWILDHLVNSTISTDFLKEYLHSSIHLDAWLFYKEYLTVIEVQKIINSFFKNSEVKLPEELMNQEFWEVVTHTLPSSKIKRLLKFFNKHYVQDSNITLDTTTSIINSNKEIHPRVQSFIEQTKKEGKLKSTQVAHMAHLNRLLYWLSTNILSFNGFGAHEIPLLRVTKEHLNDFRSYLTKQVRHGNYSPITVSECIYSVKAFFRYLKKHFGNPDPTLRLRSIPAPRYRARDLPNKQQVSKFFRTIDIYSHNPLLEQAAFRFMLSLGLRSEEVSKISWEDINLKNKTIVIHSKGGNEHILPLVGKLYECLELFNRNHPKTQYLFGKKPRTIQSELWQNYKLYSFISGWSLPGGVHLFRHIFITNLASMNFKNNKILHQVFKELARVTTLDTVSLYIQLDKNQLLVDEINKLKYD